MKVTLDSFYDEICIVDGVYNQKKRNEYIIEQCKQKSLKQAEIAMLFGISENMVTQIYRKYRRGDK